MLVCIWGCILIFRRYRTDDDDDDDDIDIPFYQLEFTKDFHAHLSIYFNFIAKRISHQDHTKPQNNLNYIIVYVKLVNNNHVMYFEHRSQDELTIPPKIARNLKNNQEKMNDECLLDDVVVKICSSIDLLRSSSDHPFTPTRNNMINTLTLGILQWKRGNFLWPITHFRTKNEDDCTNLYFSRSRFKGINYSSHTF